MCVCRVGVDRVSGLGSMLYGTTHRGHVPSDLAFRSHLGSNLELSCLPELGAVLLAMSGDQTAPNLVEGMPEQLPLPRCGCMNGEAQCLEQSFPGSVPPRCRHCMEPVYGVCQCDCFSCWDSEPTEEVEVEPMGERDAEALCDQQHGVPMEQYVKLKYGEDWIENPEAVRFVEGVMMIDVALVAGLEIPMSIPVSMLPGNWMGDHRCWICGYADHLSYVCPDNCCWICGDGDHWSDHCPDNCCWICGDRDHWSYRCPRNMKPYDSLVEAMIDLWFKDLHGEDLMSAYLIDIAAVEQRLDNVNESGCRILQERLGLLRRKAEELAMVIG